MTKWREREKKNPDKRRKNLSGTCCGIRFYSVEFAGAFFSSFSIYLPVQYLRREQTPKSFLDAVL